MSGGIPVALRTRCSCRSGNPRRPDANEADLAAALELVDFAAAGRGRDRASGTTGEFVHLDVADRLRLTQFAIKRSRLPVTVNVSHSSLEGALALARGAASSGLALLLMPPYFFRYGQEEVEEFYLRFAKELGQGPPLLLYNIPTVSTAIHFETVMKLVAAGVYAGIKDSSGRIEDFRRMLAVKRHAPFTLLAGPTRSSPKRAPRAGWRRLRCRGRDPGTDGWPGPRHSARGVGETGQAYGPPARIPGLVRAASALPRPQRGADNARSEGRPARGPGGRED